MIAAFNRWLWERQQKAREQAFEAGYAYAAVQLLRMTQATHIETVERLEAEALGWPGDTRTGAAFDKGIDVALTHWNKRCR